jgi:hydrogenase-4 component B
VDELLGALGLEKSGGIDLVLLGTMVLAVSGLPGLLWRRGASGQSITAALAVMGGLIGLAGVAVFWQRRNVEDLRYPLSLPGGEFHVQLDGLSALFLAPVFLIPLLGSIYGLGYWKQREHPTNGPRLCLFYGLLPAGMALLVIAANSLLFLIGWEVMALAAFFLVTTEDHDSEVRDAGWIYLAATHVSALCLVGLFALLGSASGSLTLEPIPREKLTPGISTAIFVLALAGFGIKAGLMPLHVWLPGAHAMAPSHVSAVMSGVLIKMGVYGIVRVIGLLPVPPVSWGTIVLALGVISGVLGVAYAIGQHDIKRLLAYHSIENVGIIIMGVGLAMIGRSLDRADLVILGLAGGLLHVWNHALFKSLLFFSAGSVIHTTGTREIDQMGGLAKRMPWTAGCFLVGAVAICGLPPLNGFVSELLVYLGLFATLSKGVSSYPAVGLAAPALALIGALALACFVKVFGAVFLGVGRSRHTASAHEAGPAMIAPMLVLVGCCLSIGLTPAMLAGPLGLAIRAWMPKWPDAEGRLRSLAPLEWIGWMGVVLFVGLAGVGFLYGVWLRRSYVDRAPTWGCGYAAPTPRMQYTSSSFAQMLVALFAWALRPERRRPRPMPLFPRPSHFHSQVPDAILEEGVVPGAKIGAWVFARLHVFQQGKIQIYLLYVFLTLVALLLWGGVQE